MVSWVGLFILYGLQCLWLLRHPELKEIRPSSYPRRSIMFAAFFYKISLPAYEYSNLDLYHSDAGDFDLIGSGMEHGRDGLMKQGWLTMKWTAGGGKDEGPIFIIFTFFLLC